VATACKFCAKKKKTCKPTDIWKEMVAGPAKGKNIRGDTGTSDSLCMPISSKHSMASVANTRTSEMGSAPVTAAGPKIVEGMSKKYSIVSNILLTLRCFWGGLQSSLNVSLDAPRAPKRKVC
jgi:hypothetical protein